MLYAYKNNCSVIVNNVANAAPYDTLGHEAHMGMSPEDSVLDTIGFLKHELSMAGKFMFGPITESISVDPSKKQISVFSKFFSPKKIRFEKLLVFDQENVLIFFIQRE